MLHNLRQVVFRDSLTFEPRGDRRKNFRLIELAKFRLSERQRVGADWLSRPLNLRGPQMSHAHWLVCVGIVREIVQFIPIYANK